MTGFTSMAVASGPDGQATHLNIYSDQCQNRVPEQGQRSRFVYYGKSPKLGECFDLNLPSNARSLNTASAYLQQGQNQNAKSAYCKLYDGFGCSGTRDISFYDASTVKANCVNYRSNQGFYWKSARCYVNQ
jgi:hypothetical protein